MDQISSIKFTFNTCGMKLASLECYVNFLYKLHGFRYRRQSTPSTVQVVLFYCGRLWVNAHVCQTHSCLLIFIFHSGLKNHYSSKSAFKLNLELKKYNINIKERGLSWCYLAQQWRPTKEHSPYPLEEK